jgi:hypothetical protein
LGKGLEITFRMAGRDAARVAGDWSRAGAIAADQARRLAERREAEIIGIFLMPLERRPLAVYDAIDASSAGAQRPSVWS